MATRSSTANPIGSRLRGFVQLVSIPRESDLSVSEIIARDIETLTFADQFKSDSKMNPEIDTEEITIRRATVADIAAITDIYNEAVLTTTATFDTEPKSVEERTSWLRSHDDRHPVLVAVVGGVVVGWASLSCWSDRCAYSDTAETSFYVHSSHRGRSIGRKLKQEIIREARRLGHHTLIARVAEGSDESLHLNSSEGFVLVGTLKEVGRKFGRLLDVCIFQKMLNDTPDRHGEQDVARERPATSVLRG